MSNSKGMVGWIFGFIAIFAVIMIFNIFIPIVFVDIGEEMINQTIAAGGGYLTEVTNQVSLVKIILPVALMILVIGVIIYMVALTQKDEPQSDIVI